MSTLEATNQYIAIALYGTPKLPAGVPFAILDPKRAKAVGSTRFFDINQEDRKLEIGWTWLGRAHWRTNLNTNCKFLLLEYAFEVANMQRVQFKANADNDRSRAAIERIGAAYEGTLRNFRYVEKTICSVSYYSILEDEWPAVKAGLQARLAR